MAACGAERARIMVLCDAVEVGGIDRSVCAVDGHPGERP